MKRLLLLASLAAGCGGDVNAEGTYTVNVANKDNGCNFMNWTPNETAQGIQVVINQEGSAVNADVMGATRVWLDLVFGAHVYNGKVDGDELDLDLIGTRSTTMGNCTLTIDSKILAVLDGDALDGRITYSWHGNGNSDCAPYDGCLSFQEMNGVRPPQ